MRRRESLLVTHPLTTPPSPTHEEGPSEAPSIPTQEAVPPTSPQAVSSSQQIASSLLAGASVEPPSSLIPGSGSAGQLSPDMAKLLAALSAGQGGSGNPVHVIIKERESKWTVLVLPLPESQAKVHGSQALRASWSSPAYPLSVSFFYACCKKVYSDCMQSSSPYFPSWSRTPGSSRLLLVNPNLNPMNLANLYALAMYTVSMRQKRSSKTWSRF